MGDTLSAPVTDKVIESNENADFRYAVGEMQGWRKGMEDAHTTLLKMSDADPNMFFGVFDGHGGKDVAIHCGNYLHTYVAESAAYQAGDYRNSLREGFLMLDHMLLTDKLKVQSGGSTCVVVLYNAKTKEVHCGNAGDSRSVMCRSGAAFPLSEDHKPANEDEARRIQNAGGFVINNRVNGILALSRAIGDKDFKQNTKLSPEEQVVTANPEITTTTLTNDDRFIIIACDGIWDVMTNDEVIKFVSERMDRGMALPYIIEEVLDHCLSPSPPGVGCDNMTLIILENLNYKNGTCRSKTKEEYEAQLSRTNST
eukprot:GFYU01002065.1.p1 GENE.GFYU01002065.1~~GFYU01002065.1.p1  ORF type:complete len:312 (+),score=68.08 GFYU01002065.1:56-991(+)